MRKSIILSCMLSILLVSSVCLSGCGQADRNAGTPSGSGSPEITENTDGSYSCDIYAMDTVMNLKAYGKNAEKALEASSDKINALDNELDVTDQSSSIYRLNHRETDTVTGDTAKLLTESLRMAETTGGNFDPTIYPAVKAWGFTTSKFRVPDDTEISDMLTHVGYGKVSLAKEQGGNTAVSFSDDKTELDTGGIGKGYTSDALQKLMKKEGVKSAIVSLGGNVMAVGRKTDGSSWNVAIEDPFDSGSYAGTVQINDESAITSGGYQRYFKRDGKTYIHIIDPATGRPVDNDLASVTIISKSGTEADALSTALYVMGSEKAQEFWKNSDLDFDIILITKDKKIIASRGAADRSFSTEYKDYKVIDK